MRRLMMKATSVRAFALVAILLVALVVVVRGSDVADAHEVRDANNELVPHSHILDSSTPGADIWEFWDGAAIFSNTLPPEGGDEFDLDDKLKINAETLAKHSSAIAVKLPTKAYDCHGASLSRHLAGLGFAWESTGNPPPGFTAHDGYWIDNPQAERVISAGFVEVKGPAMEGDIVTYRKATVPGFPELTHSGWVPKNGVNAAGDIIQVQSKWGQKGEYLHDPSDVPPSYGTVDKVYREKTKANGTGPPPNIIGGVDGGSSGDSTPVCSPGDLFASLAVGGAAGLLEADVDVDAAAGGRGGGTFALSAALAGLVVATLIAGGWYARRRWLG